jgi:succinyl-diaminopimelate desuccinylase
MPRRLEELPADALTAALVDVPSVSGDEGRLADLVYEFLARLEHLTVDRDGDAVVARTRQRRRSRVVLAGHLDTVPIADNLPSRRDGDRLYGCGTSDMKSGIAVMLRLASHIPTPSRDVTFIFYDNEEVDSDRNGLGRLVRRHPDWLAGDLAVLMEPTSGRLEAGCQGTLRALVVVTGRRAHSARAWLGDNAIHRAGAVLARLAAYEPREVNLDGLSFREGLSAVRIEGGVAGNVVPDRCTVTVNFRFAPDRSPGEALAHVCDVLSPYECIVTDSAPGAPPGLTDPKLTEFVRMVGHQPTAKYGWTDVARFAGLGMPAVNYGPGNPDLAHAAEEHVEVRRIAECEALLRRYLTADSSPLSTA